MIRCGDDLTPNYNDVCIFDGPLFIIGQYSAYDISFLGKSRCKQSKKD